MSNVNTHAIWIQKTNKKISVYWINTKNGNMHAEGLTWVAYINLSEHSQLSKLNLNRMDFSVETNVFALYQFGTYALFAWMIECWKFSAITKYQKKFNTASGRFIKEWFIAIWKMVKTKMMLIKNKQLCLLTVKVCPLSHVSIEIRS